LNDDSKSGFAPLPFRIRVGVTGHRTLPDDAETRKSIRNAIESVFWDLLSDDNKQKLQAAKDTSSPPVLYEVVSPLAEGADRIVASVLLTIPGTRLKAVLPLSVDDYMKTFSSDSARDEFQEILATHCPTPIRLREKGLSTESTDTKTQAQIRHEAFRAGGQYVVDHCDVLLALWNGEGPKKPSGTAEVVEYAVREGKPVIRIWGGQCSIHHRGEVDLRPLEGLRRYNNQVLGKGEQEERRINFDRKFFGEQPIIDEGTRKDVRKWLLSHYSRSSAMAGGRKAWFLRIGMIVYMLSLAAVLSVSIAIVFDKPLAFCIEFLLLILIVAILTFASRDAPNTAWIESRVLTERIRCAGFLALFNLDAAPLDTVPFMAHCHGLGDWMVRAFDEIRWQRPRIDSVPGFDQLRDHLKNLWFDAQCKHHRKTAEEQHAAHANLERGSLCVLGIAIAAAGLHWTWDSLPEIVRTRDWLKLALTFVAIMSPAVTAVLVSLQVQREHNRLATRSKSLEKQIEHLKTRAESVEGKERLRVLVAEADEFFLRESQDWLSLVRHVEIKGG